MATIDTRPRTTADHLANLLERVNRLEQRRTLPLDVDGRVHLPGGINTDGAGDSSSPPPVVPDPDPPTGLTLTPGALYGDVYIDADWTLPAEMGPVVALELRLDLVTDPGPGETTTIIDVLRTGIIGSARFRGLEPGATYDVHVYTVNANGVVSPALTGRTTTGADATLPGVPTGLTVAAGLRTLVARWTEVDDPDVANGAGLYDVEIALDSGFTTGVVRRRVGGTIVSIGDLDPETLYYVRIRSIDSSGNASGWSTVESATTALAGTADLAVGAITADSGIIANLAVGTAQIANAAITNAKVNDLSATKLTAGNITATVGITTGRLQIGGTAPGSTGLYLDSSGIRLYNGSTLKVHLNAATGAATFSGSITGSDITGSTLTTPGALINDDGVAILASGTKRLLFTKILAGGAAEEARFQFVDDPSEPEFQITLNAFTALRLEAPDATIYLDSSTVRSTGPIIGSDYISAAGEVIAGGLVRIINAAGTVVRLEGTGGALLQSWFRSSGDRTGWVGHGSISDVFEIRAEASDLYVRSTAGHVWLEATPGSRIRSDTIYGSTTSAAANVHIAAAGTTGIIYRSTSSRRYKRDEAPVTLDGDALGRLEIKTWRDRNDVADRGDQADWHTGLIAEDVHDLGLGRFVTYDNDGRPDGLAYDRLAIATALEAIRRIEELRANLPASPGPRR